MDFSIYRMIADALREIPLYSRGTCIGSPVYLPTNAMKAKRKRYQKRFAQSRGEKVRG